MMPPSAPFDASDLIARNAINLSGSGKSALVFLHGYGCSQAMWRFVAPAFKDSHQVVLYDHVGAGASDIRQYDFKKYGSLDGYATDLIEICTTLGIKGAVIIGHSVSSMIGALAVKKAPALFRALVMVAPSPCYVNDDNYHGGFSRQDLDGLLEMLDSNYLGWTSTVAGVAMNASNPAWMTEELRDSFCRTAPDIARHFAKVTFNGDNRRDLPAVTVPTLILQCSNDLIAPVSVGEFIHRSIAGSELVHLTANGHCPHISVPAPTVAAIREFLGRLNNQT